VAAAKRLGISGSLKARPSLALGAAEVSLLELTSAYASVANGGYGVLPHGIVEIRDAEGHRLYRRGGSGIGRVIDAGTVARLNSMLSTALESGTGKAARLKRPAAGKTGTSQEFRDAWFIGYTADLVAGVWFGNDDASPTKRVTGGGLPARTWKDFMTAALAGEPAVALQTEPPAGSSSGGDGKGLWQKILDTFGGGVSRSPASAPSDGGGEGGRRKEYP
jgi:penicillin-binding protein 1A